MARNSMSHRNSITRGKQKPADTQKMKLVNVQSRKPARKPVNVQSRKPADMHKKTSVNVQSRKPADGQKRWPVNEHFRMPSDVQRRIPAEVRKKSTAGRAQHKAEIRLSRLCQLRWKCRPADLRKRLTACHVHRR